MSNSQAVSVKTTAAKEKIYHQEIESLTEILKNYHPEKMILFGSAATGQTDDESDIDICLIKKITNSKLEEKKKIFDLLWQYNFNYLFDPDIQIYDPQEFQQELARKNPFLEEINKGQVIYER